MRGSTHLILGAAVAAPLAASAHAPALLAVGALTGLLPDLDHAGSMIGRWLPRPAAAQPGGNGFTKHGRRWFGGCVIWHRVETHSFGAGVIAATLAIMAAKALHAWP